SRRNLSAAFDEAEEIEQRLRETSLQTPDQSDDKDGQASKKPKVLENELATSESVQLLPNRPQSSPNKPAAAGGSKRKSTQSPEKPRQGVYSYLEQFKPVDAGVLTVSAPDNEKSDTRVVLNEADLEIAAYNALTLGLRNAKDIAMFMA